MRHHAADDDFVAQQRATHAGDEHVRDDAHGRHDRDVNLGVSEEPEHVLPEQRRATGVGLQLVVDDQSRRNEETRSGDVVQDEQDASRQQNRKRQSARCTR